MTIKELLNNASDKLKDIYQNYKLALNTLKQMEKDMKNELKSNAEYNNIVQDIKKLKQIRKDISEQLKEKEDEKLRVLYSLDSFHEADDFKNEMEEKYNDGKDKELNKLSKGLTESGINCELDYKSGKLTLVTTKH